MTKEKELKERIKHILYQLGVNATYLGYYYLTLAIMTALENEENLIYVSKNIYPGIAECYHTSLECVERNIRTVTEIMFKHGDKELLSQIFTNTSKKPKNSELIAHFAVYVKRNCYV